MSLRSVSEFNPFLQPQFLYEYISQLDYPSIRNLCISDKGISHLCSTNADIQKVVMKRKIEHRTDFLLSQSTPENVLYYASIYGDIDTVDDLLNRGVDPNIEVTDQDGNNTFSLFVWAIKTGNIKVIDRLLQDDRIDPSADDNSAIKWASTLGHLDVVNRLLQDSKVDPSASWNYSIMWADVNEHPDVVRRLLQDSRVRQSLVPQELKEYQEKYSVRPRSNRPLPPPPSRR